MSTESYKGAHEEEEGEYIEAPLSEEEFERLVTLWIKFRYTRRHTNEYDVLFDEVSDLQDRLQEYPEDWWRFILAVLAQDQSITVIGPLSAGLVEDLLADHGPEFIDRFEVEARANPSFATLLGGVWRSSMSDEVWHRVLAVRDRSKWESCHCESESATEAAQQSTTCDKTNIADYTDVWLKYHRDEEHPDLTDEESSRLDWVESLWIDHPEDCWKFVLELLKHSLTPTQLRQIARGPLMSLLVFKAGVVSKMIFDESKSNSMLRIVLAGIPTMLIEDRTLGAEIQQVCDREGWKAIVGKYL